MIEREDVGAVTILRLAHGPVNALDLELVEAISAAFAAVGPRAVVLSGAGRAFSAGVDLDRVVSGGADYVKRFLHGLSRAFLAAFTHPAPTVAAVGGHAIAGGAVLVAACDRRLAAAGSARLGLTELAVGVPFPVAGIEVLRHAVGRAAPRLVIDADLLDVEEALALGLVEAVVPAEELAERALGVAQRLAAIPPDVYAFTKAQLQRPALAAMGAAAGQDAAVETIWSSPAARDRITAFMARLRAARRARPRTPARRRSGEP